LRRPQVLSDGVRRLLVAAAVIDLLLGAAFFLGPELRLPLWPSALPALVSRLIGAIVLANGVGILAAVRRGTWEAMRALFLIGLVYGGLAMGAFLYHLAVLGAPRIFWVYVVLDAVYLVAIGFIFARYERAG
jgi:hypothetical protein